MKKTIFWVILVIIVALLVFVFGNKNKDLSEFDEINVGALLYLTGAGAEIGENSLKGMQLAVKEINESGGVLGKKLNIIVEDSLEDDISNTITGYRSLTRKGINFIIGPTWTPAGLALYPVASKEDVVLISPSLGVAEFNESGDNIFNTWPHDDDGTRYLAKFVYDSGIKSVAIFSSKQPWEKLQGDAFEEEFKRLGGNVLIKLEPQVDTNDFKTEVAKIRSVNPEAVVFTNYTPMAIAAKTLSDTGFSGKKFAVLMDQGRVDAALGSLENTIYVQNPPATESFQEAFRNEFGVEPQVSADTAYDAVYWLVNAIEDTESLSVDKIKDKMNSYLDFSGASGYFEFDGKGGVIKDPKLYIVSNNKMISYEE